MNWGGKSLDSNLKEKPPTVTMENFSILLLLLILFTPLIFKFLFNQTKKLPPSPIALPIIGHLHLIKQPLHQSLQILSSKFGPIIHLQLGSKSVLLVSSPSAVEECLTKNDIIFANRPQSLAADHLTYNYTTYVWAPYGHLWRVLRRVSVIEIFSSNSLQKFSSIREEEVYKLLQQLFKLSNSGIQKVDLKYFFSLLTVNVMMRMVRGKQIAGMEEEGKKFLQEFKEIFRPSLALNLCDFLPFLRWVGYKGIEKSIIKLERKRDELMQGLIDEIRSKKTSFLDSDRKRKITVIETLLLLQQSEPDFYSDEVIKSFISMMFVAGTETSSITLEWAMSLLLNHPEALEKLRTEIDNNVKHGHLLDDSDLTKLPYLRCIVNEALRLYPPAPILLPHFSSQDCTVGGFKIPRGTTLLVNAWGMQRDPKVWEEPTKFKPERFEGIEGEKEGFKFIPFGVGRRACPGAGMGMRTVSLALGALIQCFEWERVGQEKMDMTSLGPTILKAEPLVAMFNLRQNSTKLLSQL